MRNTLVVTLATGITVAASLASAAGRSSAQLMQIQHFVVIYEENHSFDNLYGGWEGVNGLSKAKPPQTLQVSQAGVPFKCLAQNDPNLTSPAPIACPGARPCLPGTCSAISPSCAAHAACARSGFYS